MEKRSFSIARLWHERNTQGTVAARLWELFKFCVAGGIGFIIDWGGLVLLKEYAGFHVLAANAVSFTVSVAVNYVLCAYWAFQTTQKKTAGTMGLFLLTSLVGLALSELFMWLFYSVMHIDYMLAKVFAVILVMIWNYFSKRRVLVREPKPEQKTGDGDSLPS